MVVNDDIVDKCFHVIREEAVPVDLPQQIMDYIYSGTEEIRLVSQLRLGIAAGMVALLLVFMSYIGQDESHNVIVAYHKYFPRNYSEKVALSSGKITKDTLYCMLKEY
jgi:hypothetical protein